MVLRVGSVREGVADEVERNGDKAQDDGGVEQLVPQARLHHHLAAVVDQVAQRGRFHRKAQADIGDEHLAADGGGVFITYIGLGLSVEVPSLGNLINDGRKVMMQAGLRYQLLYPTIILSFVTIAFYLIGNAFSDAADPKNHLQ